ncbi:SPOR domain-containing protein [Pseudogemmobacter sonorensis]|uniref:SPOR domain-containing protein n=1 Tax=Pseudogemmobacter sonorensis TaxID=2989681 RepID=UPI0036CB048A
MIFQQTGPAPRTNHGPGRKRERPAARLEAAPRAGIRALALLLPALALAACEAGSNPFTGSGQAEGAPRTQTSTRLVERDVEAPGVFQVTDDALWDGRPSLGGVWVASPDATDPERVIMRNPANGKFVIGALFRRERDNPGPALQISSDAADALGILAGQPAKISVTALRREEAPETTPETPILDSNESLGTAVAGAIDGGGVETRPLDGPTAPARPPTATPPAPPAAPAPAPAASGRPIQIGFFSVEANAKRAIDTLSKAGIAAETRQETSQGKTYWSVTARGDAALLTRIKAAGFTDAYMLR